MLTRFSIFLWLFGFRYRVNIADLNNQLGLNYHLASIHFTTSKSDVLMRLSVLDNNEEIAGVEGRGTVILPSILFMRTITNLQPPPSPTRPVSKSTAGLILQYFERFIRFVSFRNT